MGGRTPWRTAGSHGRSRGRNRSGSASAAKTDAIGGRHLREHSPRHGIERRSAKIGVEIVGRGDQNATVDARLAAVLAEPVFRKFACGVAVVKHAEPLERGQQEKGDEVGSESAAAMGRAGNCESNDSTISLPTPAAMTPIGSLKRTALPRMRSMAQHGSTTGSLAAWGRAGSFGGLLGFARRQREPVARGDLVARERHGTAGTDFAVKKFLLGGQRGFVEQSEPAARGTVPAIAAGLQELKGAFRIEDDAGASIDRRSAAERVLVRKPAPHPVDQLTRESIYPLAVNNARPGKALIPGDTGAVMR